MLYFSRDVSEFLVDYVGRDVILNIVIEDKGNCRFNVRLNATLHLTREFRPSRVSVHLPKALNPTWANLYDKEVKAIIEVPSQDTRDQALH